MADNKKVESPKAGAAPEVPDQNPPDAPEVENEVADDAPPEAKNPPEKVAEHPDLKPSKKTGVGKFGVPPGHQVPLLQANEEAWKNDAAIIEERKARALQIAEAMVSGDGLRRTRRAQKNLR